MVFKDKADLLGWQWVRGGRYWTQRPHQDTGGRHARANSRVRVAHLTSAHPTDDARICGRECGTLAAAGFDVTIVGPAESRVAIDDIKLWPIPLAHGRLRRMTVSVWRVFLGALNSGARICHFHDPELIPMAFLLKIMRRKVVYDVHEDLPAAIMDKIWIGRNLRWSLAKLAAGMELVSRCYIDAYVAATPHIARRFPRGRTYIVQNFPPREEMTPLSGPPYEQRRAKVVFVGIMEATRGVREIVEAIGLVDDPAARLVLAGKFEEPGLEQRCRDDRGWRKVDFLGWRPRKDVAKALGDARAGLVTYYPGANMIAAQPTKMFEYMSAGIPVIASDFPVWRRIVEGAGCGILVDPYDPRAIAAAIQWIFNHSKEAEEMGRKGRAAVTETYNWERESLTLLAMYRDLAG